MLEIRRGIAVKHYENSFFREFAKNLKNMFDKYNLDGLLIANSECIVDERLQIDTLLITQHVVCIIDFKNFSGKIVLPHKDDFFNGIWTNEDGNRIKGGSSINPYKQLSIQKKKFLSNPKRNIIGIYDKHIKNNFKDNDCFNPRHTLKVVCFQNKIELIGEIPSRDKIDFFIADKENYLEQIKDIIDVNDKEVNISPESYNTFKEIFKANQFDLEENYQEKIEVQEDINLDTRNLYQDQEFALKEIQKFLVSKDDKVFILNGSSNSGKSSLVPYIEEIAYKNKFQEIKKLVQSKRIANNLSSKDIKFDSIYAYIYGGQYTTEEINKNDTDIESKIIPLKTNDDEDNCLYIIDEAQLITDSFYKSIDLQFGSGHLLKDLINYINVKESKRKIIFIGDSYQLTIGSKEEVSLDLNYIINQYGLKTKLFSLIDKPNFSILTKEALKPVTQMKKQKYNFLNFDSSSFIRKIEKKDLLVFVKKSLDNDFKILVYSNSDALKINTWIKKSILNNDRDIVFDDLIMFNNNINIENSNDPFAQPQKTFNGEFATVISVNSTIIEEPIYFKNKQILLKFRELQVKLKTGETAKILSFENFRLNQKNELSDDEVIAYQILLNQLLQVENKNNPFEQSSHYRKFISSEKYKSLKAEVINLQNKLARGERVKAKKEELEKHLRKLEKEVKRKYKRELEQKLYSDTSSKLYRYKNTAWIKFGWAITVHKAISYKFNEVLINTDQGNNRGKTNENYFRWIYSAITRTTKF